MPDYAMIISGELKEVRQYDEQPPDIPHKKISWRPVRKIPGEKNNVKIAREFFAALTKDDFDKIKTALGEDRLRELLIELKIPREIKP